jgi:Uncharacterised nucleotidyltransferase
MPSTTLDPEWCLLLAACSPTERQEQMRRVQAALRGSIRWNVLFPRAERHGVLPLLYKALHGFEEAVPPENLLWLKRSWDTNVHKSMLVSRELIRIVECLSAAGIEVMPYKGLALAEMLYGDIALRQVGDIDLLIRLKDLPSIRRALADLGYTAHTPLSEAEERAYRKSGYECAFDHAAGRNLLEVQWTILPRFYAMDFDIEGLFQRATTISVAGLRTKSPSLADLLLVLSAHAAKHLWNRLVWLCDIARLISMAAVDWDWIGSQARKLGLVRILRVTMQAANRLLDVPILAEADENLPGDPSTANLADEVGTLITQESEYDFESWPYFRFMMRLRERPEDRLRFITRLALTPGLSEWRAIRLPQSLFPLYRLVRVSRLAARVIRA